MLLQIMYEQRKYYKKNNNFIFLFYTLSFILSISLNISLFFLLVFSPFPLHFCLSRLLCSFLYLSLFVSLCPFFLNIVFLSPLSLLYDSLYRFFFVLFFSLSRLSFHIFYFILLLSFFFSVHLIRFLSFLSSSFYHSFVFYVFLSPSFSSLSSYLFPALYFLSNDLLSIVHSPSPNDWMFRRLSFLFLYLFILYLFCWVYYCQILASDVSKAHIFCVFHHRILTHDYPHSKCRRFSLVTSLPSSNIIFAVIGIACLSFFDSKSEKNTFVCLPRWSLYCKKIISP